MNYVVAWRIKSWFCAVSDFPWLLTFAACLDVKYYFRDADAGHEACNHYYPGRSA